MIGKIFVKPGTIAGKRKRTTRTLNKEVRLTRRMRTAKRSIHLRLSKRKIQSVRGTLRRTRTCQTVLPMSDEAERVLRKAALFASLSSGELQALASRTSQKRFQKSELLFAEGDPCTGRYLVASGKVRIFKLSASGREQVLAVEGPGSSFAELPVFDGGNYPAASSAMEDTEVLFISRKDFQGFCREHPEVALKVIAVVASRLRRLVGIIEELSFMTVRQRLIALLLKQAEATGTPSRAGVHVELTRSLQDLTAELGTVRELVSRNLSRLQAEGFLEVEGRNIVIKDLAGLKRALTDFE